MLPTWLVKYWNKKMIHVDILITANPIKSYTNTGQSKSPSESAKSIADAKSIAALQANFSILVELMICLDRSVLPEHLCSLSLQITSILLYYTLGCMDALYLSQPALSTSLCSGKPLHSTGPWSSLCPPSAESFVLTSCCQSPCSSHCASWPPLR